MAYWSGTGAGGWSGQGHWNNLRPNTLRRSTDGWDDEELGSVYNHRVVVRLSKFVAPSDPRWMTTLDLLGDTLVSDSLVYRYDPHLSPDGLEGEEGTMSICTFWYVEALSRAGRVDEARLAFEKMITYANHLGLYAEQLGPTGEQLGNFPQAFTHLALISAAFNIDRALG